MADPTQRAEEASQQLPPILNTQEISFQFSERYCVSYVDIVDSTKTAVQIREPGNVRGFYSTYLNTLSPIVRRHAGRVIKNSGDCIIYYFPCTSDDRSAASFRQVIECGFAVLEARCRLNQELTSLGLPALSYRVSADYGRLEVGTLSSTTASDLFGSTMNICAKINSMADPNTMVIGGDLHQVLAGLSIKDYAFQDKGSFSAGASFDYPVYTAIRKHHPGSGSGSVSFSWFSPQTADPLLSNEIAKPSLGRFASRPKLMIVDDESDILATFKMFLEREGFEVETFDTARHALRRFAECCGTKDSGADSHHDIGHVGRNRSFDLVILDIRMPQINGLQLHKYFKQLDKSIKTIFVSALDAGQELVTLLPEPQDIDVIRKPVAREVFSQRVKTLLGARRIAQTNGP